MRVLAVTNMYPTPRFPSNGIFVEQQIQGLRELGLQVEVLYVNRHDLGMGAYLGLTRQVRAAVRTVKPDLVHVMYGGVMADLATRAVRDWPTVVTFHGADLQGDNLSGWKRWVVGRYGVWASRRAASRASRVVVVAKDLIARLGNRIPPGRIRVIPCGIDLRRFRPLGREACVSQLGWRPDRFHVLFGDANGDPVKRPDLARAAVEAANRLGLDAELHILRAVPNERVPVWLNASDVLLLTSKEEGSPTIVKEALACDRPVVSVNVGDVAERIRDIEGCHLAREDPDDLADKVRRVHASRQPVKGRERMEGFSLERTASHLLACYREAVRDGPPQVPGGPDPETVGTTVN
jgi:glycosyltransferase involved in cell wall biosynthesis